MIENYHINGIRVHCDGCGRVADNKDCDEIILSPDDFLERLKDNGWKVEDDEPPLCLECVKGLSADTSLKGQGRIDYYKIPVSQIRCDNCGRVFEDPDLGYCGFLEADDAIQRADDNDWETNREDGKEICYDCIGSYCEEQDCNRIRAIPFFNRIECGRCKWVKDGKCGNVVSGNCPRIVATREYRKKRVESETPNTLFYQCWKEALKACSKEPK